MNSGTYFESLCVQRIYNFSKIFRDVQKYDNNASFVYQNYFDIFTLGCTDKAGLFDDVVIGFGYFR